MSWVGTFIVCDELFFMVVGRVWALLRNLPRTITPVNHIPKLKFISKLT